MADLSNTNTTTRFSVIQPELLPAMRVLESVDTEQILSNRMSQLVTIWNQHDPPNAAVYDVGALEFDPIRINQELNTYFELLLRDRVNQACRAITLAFATGSDLDAVASRYPGGLPRLTDETDDHYRRRIWLAPNTMSPNGVAESYQFWALTAANGLLRDASAIKIRPDLKDDPIVIVSCLASGIETKLVPNLFSGNMNRTVTVISNPRPATADLLSIREYVLDETRLAMTDVVSINEPKVKTISYHVKVWLYPGPETATVIDAVTQALIDLVINRYWLGFDHTRMAIAAACSQVGVYNVNIVSPAEDVFVDPDSVVQVTRIEVEYMGRNE